LIISYCKPTIDPSSNPRTIDGGKKALKTVVMAKRAVEASLGRRRSKLVKGKMRSESAPWMH
jgi:hypothetical protein